MKKRKYQKQVRLNDERCGQYEQYRRVYNTHTQQDLSFTKFIDLVILNGIETLKSKGYLNG